MNVQVRHRGPARTAVAAFLSLAVGVVVLVAGAPPLFAATAPAYVVVGPTQKVMRNVATVPGSTGAQLMGAGNEFVSTQIVLPGGSTGQTGVSVATGTTLTGAAGTIPNSNVTIYREDYYTTGQASAGGRTVGPWPDALIPTVDRLHNEARRAFPVDVPAGQNRVAFVDILVPATQAAGGYDGTLTVSNTSGGSSSVPVHLDVRGFALPATSSLRSLLSIGWRTPCDALYGAACDPFASTANEQRAWQADSDVARLALDDRTTIADPNFQPPSNSSETALFNTYTLPLINGTAATQLPGARLTTVAVDPGYLAQWKSLATADGFADRAVVYDATHCDEPGSNTAKWDSCRTYVNQYKAAWPGLPNVMTTNIGEVNAHDPSYGITDILTPVADQMDSLPGTSFPGDQHHNYDTFLSNSGKQTWLYTSCDVSGCGGSGETDPYFQHPWVDYTIDTAGGQNRAMGWLAYTYNATGELYYSATQQMPTAWTDQFVSGGNGDGTLFYPGTTDRIGGTTPIPLESLRLKMIRDGHQDYEYLRIAAQHGHAADAMNVAKTLYPSTHDAGAGDTAIDNARRQLADYITGPVSPPAPTYTAGAAGEVVVDGQLDEYQGLPAITLTGSDNTATYRLAWDSRNLYLAAAVTDDVLRTNQSGRDGEVWDGDGVELMLSRAASRAANPTPDDYHLLINVDGAATDERGTGTTWDRTWTAKASTSVVRTTGGYTVEVALPWSSVGGTPAAGSTLGLDVANNDSDTAGSVTPFDWAHLTHFAQPNAWGNLKLA